MWLNKDIFYQETFLSDYELEALGEVIKENQDIVSSILSNPDSGGYHTFSASEDIIDSVANRMFQLLKDNDFEFGQFYPRQEIQFIGPNSGQSVHIDGDGSGKDVSWGLVCYISDPEEYNGGEIFYPDHDVSIKPARGSLAIHRGNIKHGVTEVSKNPRYVIVAFTSFK